MSHVLELDEATEQRLNDLARASRQTPSNILQKAIREFIDRAQREQEFDRHTVTSWWDYEETGLHLTADEVDEWLSRRAAGEEVPMPVCHT